MWIRTVSGERGRDRLIGGQPVAEVGNGPARSEANSAEPRADLPRVPIRQLSM